MRRASSDVRAELEDRFGPLPAPADRLLTIAALRAAMRRWGLSELVLTPKEQLRLSPVSLRESQLVRLERRFPGHRVRAEQGELLVPLPRPVPEDLIAWAAGVLREIFGRR
jgi:transcription-repair coupling factor (superfamily II helicase)